MDWIELGQKYRRMRLQCGLTIRGAAQKAEVSHQIWDFIERAQRENVLVSTLEAMASAVNAKVTIELHSHSEISPVMAGLIDAVNVLSDEDKDRLLSIAKILGDTQQPLMTEMLRAQLDGPIALARKSSLSEEGARKAG